MEKFSLIKALSEDKEGQPNPLPDGVKYQQYELEVDGDLRIVNIPLRETENFENLLSEYESLNREKFNLILRTVRGIRG